MNPLAVVGFFKDYWKLFALVLLVASAYVKGCSDEKERFDEFKGAVAAIGKAQHEKSVRIAADQKAITTKKDANHAETKRHLDLALGRVGDLAGELRKRPGRSIVPPVPASAGGGEAGAGDSGIICFASDRLRAGIEGSLQRFGERYRGLAGRGAGAIAGFETCATWALEQEAAAQR